jgi:hypothetical protein
VAVIEGVMIRLGVSLPDINESFVEGVERLHTPGNPTVLSMQHLDTPAILLAD